jgi:hypothetical protein
LALLLVAGAGGPFAIRLLAAGRFRLIACVARLLCVVWQIVLPGFSARSLAAFIGARTGSIGSLSILRLSTSILLLRGRLAGLIRPALIRLGLTALSLSPCLLVSLSPCLLVSLLSLS